VTAWLKILSVVLLAGASAQADSPADCASYLLNRLRADTGPRVVEQLQLPLARVYDRIQWRGDKPYWPSVKMAADAQKNHPDSRALHDFLKATSGSIVHLYDVVAARETQNTRYSQDISGEDLHLILQSVTSERPNEILQVRLVYKNGGSQTLGEISGDGGRIRFDEDELVKQIYQHATRQNLTAEDLSEVDLVHTHPVEPMILETDGGQVNWLFDISESDKESAKQLQMRIPYTRVQVTALVGLRPGRITKVSFSPKGFDR
jgi:hypothetical protein